MRLPQEGSNFQIHSYKHDGKIHRVWRESTVLSATPEAIIGANRRTLVTESDGRNWWTREPAVCYFHSRYWFNIIGMLREDGIYFYCNLSSPYVFDDAIKYIDYDLDLKVYPDMSYSILDEDEFTTHQKKMEYPKEIEVIVRKNLKTLISWVENREGPFAEGFVEDWYNKYSNSRKKQIGRY